MSRAAGDSTGLRLPARRLPRWHDLQKALGELAETMQNHPGGELASAVEYHEQLAACLGTVNGALRALSLEEIVSACEGYGSVKSDSAGTWARHFMQLSGCETLARTQHVTRALSGQMGDPVFFEGVLDRIETFSRWLLDATCPEQKAAATEAGPVSSFDDVHDTVGKAIQDAEKTWRMAQARICEALNDLPLSKKWGLSVVCPEAPPNSHSFHDLCRMLASVLPRIDFPELLPADWAWFRVASVRFNPDQPDQLESALAVLKTQGPSDATKASWQVDVIDPVNEHVDKVSKAFVVWAKNHAAKVKADTKPDTSPRKFHRLPGSRDALRLATIINKSKDTDRPLIDFAREFTEHDETKAQSLLRKIRAFKLLGPRRGR